MIRYRAILLLLLSLLTITSSRGEMTPPLKIPLQLSANFGELRANHFHSGIDLKTQGRTGLSVYAMDDGYVARVLVSPWGFGRAIYINHPSGLTTVYGHLDSFASFIDDIVRSKQYAQEAFRIDCEFAPDEIPVKKGQIIGKSGNSGSSGGPHLHLDIRDTETQDPLDPQQWLPQIADNVSPEARRIVVYLHNTTQGNRIEKKVKLVSSGNYTLADTIPVWGDISLGIEAYDRMTGTKNIYGVHQVNLFVNDQLFFSTEMSRYTFDESRYINSYTEKGKVMRTYIAPGNQLKSIYKKTTNRGILNINSEQPYHCRYELTDLKGNSSTVSFNLIGKYQEPVTPSKSGTLFSYATDNHYNENDFSLTIPAGALYEDVIFTYKATPSSQYHSSIYALLPESIVLHKSATLKIPLTNDSFTDKSKYYMVQINGKKVTPIIGKYQNGVYTANIQQFNSFAIAIDTIAPTITPLTPEQWGKGTISLKIEDKESGIHSYRGEIDGEFVLFELDGKTGKLTYRIEPDRVKKGSKHNLQISVVDACGNKQVYNNTFNW